MSPEQSQFTVRQPVKVLDDKSRCCGRKPIVYKRDGHLFCHRCCAAYDIVTGKQITNWAYRVDGDEALSKPGFNP